MFKKNDKVTYITCWNDARDFAFYQATVLSCGKKRMVLTCDAHGYTMGRNYKPSGVDSYRCTPDQLLSGTFARMTDADAEALCNELSAREKAIELDALTQRQAEGENDYWRPRNAALRAKLEATPVAHKMTKDYKY